MAAITQFYFWKEDWGLGSVSTSLIMIQFSKIALLLLKKERSSEKSNSNQSLRLLNMSLFVLFCNIVFTKSLKTTGTSFVKKLVYTDKRRKYISKKVTKWSIVKTVCVCVCVCLSVCETRYFSCFFFFCFPLKKVEDKQGVSLMLRKLCEYLEKKMIQSSLIL